MKNKLIRFKQWLVIDVHTKLMSRKKRLTIIRELRQIRRKITNEEGDVVLLYARFVKLMMMIRGQVHISWGAVAGMATILARKQVLEMEISLNKRLTTWNKRKWQLLKINRLIKFHTETFIFCMYMSDVIE